MSNRYVDTLLHIDFYFTRVIYWKTTIKHALKQNLF